MRTFLNRASSLCVIAIVLLWLAPAHAGPPSSAPTLASALAECGVANLTPPTANAPRGQRTRETDLWAGDLGRNLSCRLEAYHMALEHRAVATDSELIAARDAYNHDVDILNAIVPADCATRYDGCGLTSAAPIHSPALQAVLDQAPHEDRPEYGRMLAACGSINLAHLDFPAGRTASQNQMESTNRAYELWALETRNVLACRRSVVSEATNGDIQASSSQILSPHTTTIEMQQSSRESWIAGGPKLKSITRSTPASRG